MKSRALPLLALAAAINMAAGVWLVVTELGRTSDLLTMYVWSRMWLFSGENLYTANALTDYPPNAIIAFSPLAFLGGGWVVPVWTVVGLALAPALPYVATRVASIDRRMPAAVPVLLVMCWAASRMLVQFSVLPLTLALAALVLAERRPVAGGMCLGLALAKPHIAGPVVLCVLLARRWRVVAVAAAVVAFGWILYSVRAHVDPWTTLVGYSTILTTMFSGSDAMIGWTSIRAWTSRLGTDTRANDLLWLSTCATLMVAAGVSLRQAASGPERVMVSLSLFGLWSLLAFYHNGQNLVLMIPAFFLILTSNRLGVGERIVVAGLLQVALMIGTPARLVALTFLPPRTLAALVDLDRVVVMSTFVYVAVLPFRAVRGAAALAARTTVAGLAGAASRTP